MCPQSVMLSMGGLCAGSPEAKVLVAFFVLLLEGSFGITVMVMGWAGLIDCEVTSCLRYSYALEMYPDGN